MKYRYCDILLKLEDLKVLKRLPDLLNNVQIGHGQLRRIRLAGWPFWSNDLKQIA